MSMKASEVGAWLRKSAGKRDHHELMSEDYVVLRPGPNFHWLIGDPAADQPTASAPEQGQTGESRREADENAKRLP